MSFSLSTHSAEETWRLGEALAQVLQPGDVISVSYTHLTLPTTPYV